MHELNKKLCEGKHYQYTLANIVKLLNQLSGYQDAPHNNIKWGYAALAVIVWKLYCMESIFKQMRVKGTDGQQQAKQCMRAAMPYMEGDKIMNISVKEFNHYMFYIFI